MSDLKLRLAERDAHYSPMEYVAMLSRYHWNDNLRVYKDFAELTLPLWGVYTPGGNVIMVPRPYAHHFESDGTLKVRAEILLDMQCTLAGMVFWKPGAYEVKCPWAVRRSVSILNSDLLKLTYTTSVEEIMNA